MFKKIEIGSKFLEENFKNSDTIHFFSDGALLYIKLPEMEKFAYKSMVSLWFELEITNVGPFVVLYFEVENQSEKKLFEFYYDIVEDMEEIEFLIKSDTVKISVLEFMDEKLYAGYKYLINSNDEFRKDLKALKDKAQGYVSEIGNYNFEDIAELFFTGKGVLDFKTKNLSDYSIEFLELLKQEMEEEEKFFTYTSKANGAFYDDGESLQVKVYKREDYEKLKKTHNTFKREKISEIELLKQQIDNLEKVIEKQKHELEKLRNENIHLKEELEYKKLDNSKKGWKLF